MGDPELRSDEKVLARSEGIHVKLIPFEGILTNKRIILVDRVKNILPPKEIPLINIREIDTGGHANRDQILTLSLMAKPGVTRQMVLAFSYKAGGDRKKERDAWAKILREHTSLSEERVVLKAVPGHKPAGKKAGPPEPPGTGSKSQAQKTATVPEKPLATVDAPHPPEPVSRKATPVPEPGPKKAGPPEPPGIGSKSQAQKTGPGPEKPLGREEILLHFEPVNRKAAPGPEPAPKRAGTPELPGTGSNASVQKTGPGPRKPLAKIIREDAPVPFEPVNRKATPVPEPAPKKAGTTRSLRPAIIDAPVQQAGTASAKPPVKKEAEIIPERKIRKEEAAPAPLPAAKEGVPAPRGKNLYCSECGKRIPPGSLFCNHCGSRIDTT